MKKVLLEALVVLTVGAFLSLAANTLSPRGLRLSRDYFPAIPVTATNQTNGAQTPSHPLTNSWESVTAAIKARGLQVADSNKVSTLFRDPRFQQELIVFLDARNPAQYREGHIPGAHLLDYYQYEKYLPALLPALTVADEIVIYCNGGSCDDSQLTAVLLHSAGIPNEKLFVYAGGFNEWRTNLLPVEIGERNSNLEPQRVK
jgi:rhodanese-related sulfurtransferase